MSVFLESERVYLRPHEPDDADKMYTWFNNVKITRLTGEVYPLSREEAKERIEAWTKDKNSLSLSVVTKADDKLIGTAGLINIDTVHRRAELAIIIGEEAYWSRGYGTETIKALLNYGFNRLNLNMVYLGVIDINERAIKAYKKVGFVQDGVIREKYLIDGKYCNCIMMSILEREFKKKLPDKTAAVNTKVK